MAYPKHIEFIWKYNDIEHYIPVIEKSIHETYNYLHDEDINNDMQTAIITSKNGNAFALYINNRVFKKSGSIYSIFKEQYKAIARAYDDVAGIRVIPETLDEFIKLFRKITPTLPKKEIVHRWNERQELKRKITNFTTLGNKSINRGRRVPPKLRFEVLKRDKFRCVTCGRTARDTTLHVDHIAPVIRGGKNDKDNLVTLCRDCNLGKGTSD